MVEGSCICDRIPSLTCRTRLSLILHRREAKKTTNTGLVAARVLTGSVVHEWGHQDQPLTAADLVAPDSQGLVLTTAEGATVLDADAAAKWRSDPRPITLVVPDGSWRQASKMPRRIPGLDALPWVRLPPGPPSSYQLRDERHVEGLATLEAIARAFGALEGLEVQRALEGVFDTMVSETLRSRGLGSFQQ
ncbi:MAG: DTW domain-containing protein YfiP [Myxococcota bacterium]|jgi:DTW domain-containing protein YfiP